MSYSGSSSNKMDDILIDDMDLDYLICDSPTSVFDNDVVFKEEEKDPIVMAAELAHRGHLDRLIRIKKSMEEELQNLQQNPLLWQPKVRKIFNSMRISLNHMKAVVDATSGRDLSQVSPIANKPCYGIIEPKQRQQNRKFYAVPKPRPLS